LLLFKSCKSDRIHTHLELGALLRCHIRLGLRLVLTAPFGSHVKLSDILSKLRSGLQDGVVGDVVDSLILNSRRFMRPAPLRQKRQASGLCRANGDLASVKADVYGKLHVHHRARHTHASRAPRGPGSSHQRRERYMAGASPFSIQTY
jgi:hypothetical protein